MFHPDVVADRLRILEESGRVASNGGKLIDYTVDDARWFTRRLKDNIDKNGVWLRRLTPDEEEYITNETWRVMVDWKYWAERYCYIRKGGSSLAPMYPLWESQEHVLEALGKLEKHRHDTRDPDGCLLDVLKARQLGVSTMTQSIIAHRISCWGYTYSLIAADRPEQSLYLFGMLEITLDHVPPYLRSQDKGGTHPKAGPMVLQNGSVVEVGSGRTMVGQDTEEGAGRGQIGVGKTYSALHLSEIPTWPYPEMMDSSLIPAIPREHSTFCVREATAQGRNNYWHTQWQLDVAGKNRFKAVFIPWFIEKQKYWMPVPDGWAPSAKTLAYVARAEQNAPRWLFGRSVQLTTEQVYWYETERAAAEARDSYEPGSLSYFLANYPAEPEESFQHSGRSVFGPGLLDRLRQLSRPIVAAVDIQPADELAQLKRSM